MSGQGQPPPIGNYHDAFIKLKTANGDEHQGEVYCYDVQTQIVVLKEPLSNGRVNIRVIRTNFAKGMEAIREPPKSIDDRPLPPLDRKVLERREARALEDFKAQKALIGIKVTQEAQDMFDFIHKTHPGCQWQHDTIVVLGVQVVSPYAPENCTGGDEKSLARIREVVAKFRDRRARREGEQPQQQPPPPSTAASAGSAAVTSTTTTTTTTSDKASPTF